MSSYAIAENYNLQTLLWSVAGATYRVAMAVRSVLPALRSAIQILTLTLLLTLLIAGAVMVAAIFWATLLQVALAAGVITLFALATYPGGKHG